MMSVPKLTLSLSSEGTLQKWNDLDKTVAELIPKLQLTDTFVNLDNWTETDTTGKVNVIAGGLEMDGNNAAGQTGVQLTQGLSRKVTKIKVRAKTGAVGLASVEIFIKNTTGIPTAIATNQFRLLFNASNVIAAYDGTGMSNGAPVGVYAVDTDYNIAFYIHKSTDGFWSKVTATIQGGIYTSETVLYCSDKIQTEVAAIFYCGVQRYLFNASGKALVSSVEVYYELDTTGVSTLIGIADAGAGKKFINFDPSKITVPTGFSTAYNKVAYDFSDSATPSLGSYYTYTELLSRPKILEERKYLHISVQQNSDGVVQPYAGILLNEGVVDGINFEYQKFHLDKSVVSVTAGTLLTVTLDNDLASIMTGLTLKGVACTDRTVTGANTLTFVAPTLTADIGNVVGSFTGYDDFTITNGVTATNDAPPPGPDTVMGMLIKLHKQFYGTGKIEESPSGSGRFYLVLYDNDGGETDTVIAKCELKGYGGSAVASFVGNTSPCVRLKSMIDVVPTIPESATVLGILEKMINYEFGKKIQKEIPVGSGKFFEVIYDSAGTEIGRCLLKAYGGAEIASPEGSTEPVERLRSTV